MYAIRSYYEILLPVRIPLLSGFFNRILVNIPLLRKLALVHLVIARPAPVPVPVETLSCS